MHQAWQIYGNTGAQGAGWPSLKWSLETALVSSTLQHGGWALGRRENVEAPQGGSATHSAASAGPYRRWLASGRPCGPRRPSSRGRTPPRPGRTSWGCGSCGCWCCAWPSCSGGAARSGRRSCRCASRRHRATPGTSLSFSRSDENTKEIIIASAGSHHSAEAWPGAQLFWALYLWQRPSWILPRSGGLGAHSPAAVTWPLGPSHLCPLDQNGKWCSPLPDWCSSSLWWWVRTTAHWECWRVKQRYSCTMAMDGTGAGQRDSAALHAVLSLLRKWRV